jgi:hypothetical protein
MLRCEIVDRLRMTCDGFFKSVGDYTHVATQKLMVADLEAFHLIGQNE